MKSSSPPDSPTSPSPDSPLLAIREPAPAKVNLSLHIVGRREDGYHELESVVAFADVGDVLAVEEWPRASGDFVYLSCVDLGEAIGVDPGVLWDGSFTVERAAAALWARRLIDDPATMAVITLTKNLPIAAGLGGGSADAAATLRALNGMWGDALSLAQMAEIGLTIGADVPVCVHGRAAWMSGVGERVAPLEGWPELPAVLVNPRRAVSTKAVFAAIRERGEPFAPAAAPPKGPLTAADAIAYLSAATNSMQPAAVALEPAIGDVLEAIAGGGAALARMSGSGATCFGLYQGWDEARRAAGALAAARPDWWVRACRLGDAPDRL